MSALDQRSTMTPTLEQMSEHGHPPSPNCLLPRAGSDSPNHSPTCLSLAGGTGTLTPKLELLYEVLRYCDVRDLVRLAATSKFSMVVWEYIYLRRKILALRFFDNVESFYQVLSACHVVIPGSAAMHFLLPATDTN